MTTNHSEEISSFKSYLLALCQSSSPAARAILGGNQVSVAANTAAIRSLTGILQTQPKAAFPVPSFSTLQTCPTIGRRSYRPTAVVDLHGPAFYRLNKPHYTLNQHNPYDSLKYSFTLQFMRQFEALTFE